MDGTENAAFDSEAQYIPKAGEEFDVDSISTYSPKEQVTDFDEEINTVEGSEEDPDGINEEEWTGQFDEDNRRLFLVNVFLIGISSKPVF